MYNGSQYEFTGDINVDANTTYSAMSASEVTTGTATTARTITAKVLADYVTSKVSAVVNSAPETLNTLKKLSDALGSDPNFATTMTNALANKLDATATAVNASKVNNLTVQTAVPANAKFTDTTYSNFVKSGSTAAAGLVPKPSTTAGTTKYLREDGTWSVPPDTNTTYSNMTAATSSEAGTAGLVPAPAKGKQTSFLRGDGTWVVPTNTTYSNFVKSGSTAAAGLVPAPSTTAGTTKYLREDGTWQAPPNTTYTAASATPLVAGTAAVGTSAKYAREDHVHPAQTTVSGNAGTATKLATARTINGTSFNGSANITTTSWGTARNITIKDSSSTNAGTAVSVDGSAAVTLLLPATIKASITGNCSGSSGSCTGNAATATSATSATSSTTQAHRNASTKIATTAFVQQNANRMLTDSNTIYVSKTGTGDGTTAAKAMSIDDLSLYLAVTKMQAGSESLNGSYILTIAFVPAGETYGTVTFDSNKMPGVKNIIITTSTGTNSTTSNYTTNSPLFDNLNFFGPINVTLRNVEVTTTISSSYGAKLSLSTYVGAGRFEANSWSYMTFGSGTYNIHNVTTANLFTVSTYAYMNLSTATMTFNFREQCHYTGYIFSSSIESRLYAYWSRIKFTGTTPVVAVGASGTTTGTSSTAAGTKAKVVTLAEGQTFTLAEGAVAYVTFDNANTAASPTLNINSTGAKSIYYDGAAIPANYIAKNVKYKFTYTDGKYVCGNIFNRLDNVTDGSLYTSNGSYSTTYNSGEWNLTGFTTNRVNGSIVNGVVQGSLNGNAATATKINGKTIPVVSSFDSTTGTLTLTSLS